MCTFPCNAYPQEHLIYIYLLFLLIVVLCNPFRTFGGNQSAVVENQEHQKASLAYAQV